MYEIFFSNWVDAANNKRGVTTPRGARPEDWLRTKPEANFATAEAAVEWLQANLKGPNEYSLDAAWGVRPVHGSSAWAAQRVGELRAEIQAWPDCSSAAREELSSLEAL